MRVDRDLHRNSLNDLGEIARSIIGRQQCELLAAGRSDAVDHAMHGRVGKCIHVDGHRLPGPYVSELRLLVVWQ